MENLKNVAPVEDFNWDAYENGETFAGVSHEELEKAYDSTLNRVNDREVVDGTVIAMNKREVVVNIGYKSDGIILSRSFLAGFSDRRETYPRLRCIRWQNNGIQGCQDQPRI